MRTTRKQLAISIALIFALFPSLALAHEKDGATQQVGDWSSISSVPSGDHLFVKLKSGQTIEGKLIAVSDTALTMSVKSKVLEVKREDVSSVYHAIRKSATKATLIGMAAGAGGGAVIGAIGSSTSGEGFDKIDQVATAGFIVIGAGVGAGVGYLIGRKSRKRVLIYQAP